MAFTIKVYSKAELAQLYKVSGKTLREWLREILGTVGREKLLSPAQVQKIVDAFGPPEVETSR